MTLAEIQRCLPSGYRIQRYLERGGQGLVFLGEFEGQAAALKLFRPTSDPRRLERELELLRAIRCPHLVRILDHTRVHLAGQTCALVAYEFHPGGDLRALLEPAHPDVDADTLIVVGSAVAAAIEALWARRSVHRDIKPANLVRAADGLHRSSEVTHPCS